MGAVGLAGALAHSPRLASPSSRALRLVGLLFCCLVTSHSGETGCERGARVQWLYLLNVTQSNLGGLGPDKPAPHTLRFDSALAGGPHDNQGECVALEVSVAEGGEYRAENPAQNGAARGVFALRGGTKMGQVSVKARTQADLVFSLVRCGGSEPAALPRLNLTFYSALGSTRQTVTASGYAESLLGDPRLFNKSYTDNGTSFSSAGGCHGVPGSEECSFTLHYKGIHKLPLILESGGSDDGDVVEPFRFAAAACSTLPRGDAERSACDGTSCGEGLQLLPAELLPSSCRQEACSEAECCRPANPGDDEEGLGMSSLLPVGNCSGKEQQWHVCDQLPECNVCEPEDCTFSDWSAWTAVGGCSGLCERSREPGRNNECGEPCSGSLTETEARPDDPACFPEECFPVSQDCKWGVWSDWTECAQNCEPCKLDQSFRSRRIAEPPKGLGHDCEGVWNQTRPCQATHDQDCQLSSWNEWTECSQTCGRGWRARMRRIVQEARFGGKPCSGSGGDGLAMRETSSCNEEDCAEKFPCVMADWSDWHGCDAASGLQRFRHREILMPPVNGASGCDHVLNQTAECPGAPERENCTLSDWSPWSECSSACAGQRNRTRTLQSPTNQTLPCLAQATANLSETEPCDTEECSKAECEMSSWSEWGDCKGQCGQGMTLRLRHAAGKRHTARACEASLEEVKACDTGKDCASVDCEWDEWEDWSECTATCGGGTRLRSRAVQNVPAFGGAPCAPEAKAEVGPCAQRSCHKCVDGTWGSWSSWGTCSGTCFPAYKARHREPERENNFCGKPASGPEDEFALCQELKPCKPAQDCELSDWGSWSDCATKCFGVRERQRHVTQMASPDGEQCHNESLKEVEPCNPGVGETVPSRCGAKSSSSCKVGDWGEWSECSASCDGGQKRRSRHVLSPAFGGGAACDEELAVAAECGTEPCNRSVECRDCEWGDWSRWGACSRGGQRVRHRSVSRLPNACGRACDPGASRETEGCQGDAGGALYCGWSEWENMGECKPACGPATRMRQRTLTLSKNASGRDYLFASDGSSPCDGNQIDVDLCDVEPCEGQCTPANCIFSPWSEWSQPTCEQLCTRKREVKTAGSCGGLLCEGPLLETTTCSKDCFQPLDCRLADWSAWNTTDCNESCQQYRSRGVEARAENGGRPCSGQLTEARPCDHEAKPQMDCELADWEDWTVCTENCGGGISTRSRSVAQEPVGGGSSCSGSLDEIQQCNTAECVEVRDCVFGAWSEWSECGETDEVKFRGREINRLPINGGTPCSGALRESAACSVDADCKVSAWTKWDECDRSCGAGQQGRQRFVVRNPRGRGVGCPRSLIEVRGCAEVSCADTDCTVSDWSEWSFCTSSCGPGWWNRSRTFKSRPCDSGVGCNLDLAEVEPCSGPPCICRDCRWGDWDDWSRCSSRCDGGQRTRRRVIEQAPELGCKTCAAEVKEEMEPCNTQSCEEHVCVDGEWADWGQWEACSSSCAGGWTWRSRLVSKEANDCGQPALGNSQESQQCNSDVPCKQDKDCEFGQWGEWGECSAGCAGVKRRERVITRHAVEGGQDCEGPLEQGAPCQALAGLLDWQADELYLDLGNVANNNLGYAGPGPKAAEGSDDRLVLPPNIRFGGVLRVPAPAGCKGTKCNSTTADLVIFPKSPYEPCDVGLNGRQGSRMGVISMQSASQVDLELALVDSLTGTPLEVEALALKFFDLDQGEGGESSEVVSTRGFKSFQLVHGAGVVFATDRQTGLTMFHAGSRTIAPEHDPENTTAAQERRAVAIVYSKVSKVDVTLEVSPGSLCQSFVFVGRACVLECKMADPCREDALTVDCMYSDWADWSECSASCGAGQQQRSRVVIEEAAGNGTRCTGALSETASCNNSRCKGICEPMDCAWGEWDSWGECNWCGGQVKRSRKVLRHAKCGGRSCEPGAAEQVARCPRACHGKTWCIWDDWQAFGPCSATCGQGLRSRERHLKSSKKPPLGFDGANATKADKARIEGKFAQLHASVGGVRTRSALELALAFAAGSLSMAAFFAAAQRCRRVRALGRQQASLLQRVDRTNA